MATKVHMCDECEHFICNRLDPNNPSHFEIILHEPPCGKGHKPHFYMPRNNDPYDDRCGYKRKCDDFESVEVC